MLTQNTTFIGRKVFKLTINIKNIYKFNSNTGSEDKRIVIGYGWGGRGLEEGGILILGYLKDECYICYANK